MRILRNLTYLLLAAALIFVIFTLLTTDNKGSDKYDTETQDTNILMHPEKYPYYDTIKSSKPYLNGTAAFIDLSDIWTEFIPGIHLHSAFASEKFSKSGEIQIRIIAAGKKSNIDKSKVKCLLRNNDTLWEETLADLIINSQGPYLYFTFLCISKQSTLPQRISLNYTLNPNPSKYHWMNIHYKREEKRPNHQITVCVPATLKKIGDAQLLAEFLAYYDTVGVTSFVFYDSNLAKNDKKFIDTVSRSGLNITIVPWTLPIGTISSMSRVLQIASIQHCIFQNRGISKFVLPININEFLVPRQHFSLPELMEELSTISKHQIGSFIFRQSYFCPLNATSVNSVRKEEIQLVSTRDLFREDKIWTAKKRSRYMVQPDSVIEGGFYHILKHVKGWISANVPWQLALIHNYILCPHKQNVANLVEDRTAESFRYEILLSKPMITFREFKSVIKNQNITIK